MTQQILCNGLAWFLPGSSVLDTQGTLFRELGRKITCYVRILRVCYISSTSQPRQPLTALACKTFVPCQLTQQGTFAPPTFETQSQTMRRALTWLQATGKSLRHVCVSRATDCPIDRATLKASHDKAQLNYVC